MPTAREAIKACNDQGWLVIVVTNQAGIARGYYDRAAVERLHAWMQAQLHAIGAHVDAFYYCPHHPEGCVSELAIPCDCRKPKPGMLLTALRDWPIDPTRAYLIGDKPSDLEAAHRAGVRGVLYDGSQTLLEQVRELSAVAP
jgi:D-glycero-D-manno-heptose 1,7-bisphosphate phosphatase